MVNKLNKLNKLTCNFDFVYYTGGKIRRFYLIELLLIGGLYLITSLKQDEKCFNWAKRKDITLKRLVIETVREEVKNKCQIQYSRLRSFNHFVSL